MELITRGYINRPHSGATFHWVVILAINTNSWLQSGAPGTETAHYKSSTCFLAYLGIYPFGLSAFTSGKQDGIDRLGAKN